MSYPPYCTTKAYIDGMPMDNSNTSFGLNNIPAGFASQLQVYKGVVPVDLGGDAIGGVIRLVMKSDIFLRLWLRFWRPITLSPPILRFSVNF